ncbi:MAG: SEC-C metal-binding domain-containing protein [Planctomycetia bacterium]|nr:SEC-C metal-binding domain-containing protein [Planctomycetia bacterium]
MDKRLPDDPDFLSQMGYCQRVETIRMTGRKLGRNDPCRCGSGIKYKRCCGATKQQKALWKAQRNRDAGAYTFE